MLAEIYNFCNVPFPRVRKRYCDVYRRSEIYTLSISTGKNQSKKVYGALYIPTYEYNYKFITGYDTILQEYYITNANARIQRDIQLWIVQKVLMSYKKKTQETSMGPGRTAPRIVNRWSTILPCPTLITRKSITVQTSRSGHVDPGELKTLQWVARWVPSALYSQTHVYR